MKILSIGNSFAEDTMTHLPAIAADLGENFYFAYLYIGGCPIGYHYLNAVDDLPVYRYNTNGSGEWSVRRNVRISEAILEQDWDWINIQHGSKDGRCYTDPVYYKHLGELISYIRTLAGKDVKISFNMAWVPDPEKEHHEMMDFYGNDPQKMYAALTALTRDVVAATPGIDQISPAGTAVQNARAAGLPELTRDGFHVSYGLGRYIAALTFLKALTDWDITKVRWTPEEMDKNHREVAIRCALAAIETPYDTSKI